MEWVNVIQDEKRTYRNNFENFNYRWMVESINQQQGYLRNN